MGVIGECLGISQQKILFVLMLKCDAVAERSDIVTQMQGAGRPVASQDYGVKISFHGHYRSSFVKSRCLGRMENDQIDQAAKAAAKVKMI